jgi:transcriptional antiterminator RfaH
MSPWYLAQVKPNADTIARRNLERQRFEVFQPLERRTQIRAGRFVPKIRPFFPGYLFLSYPEAHAPWSLVNSTYGISRVVSFAGKPAQVPSSVISGLRAGCGADEIIAMDHSLQPGDEVEVANGAFATFIGEVERLAPDHRVLVLMDFMGKQTRIMLRSADVRRMDGSRKAGGLAR